MNKSYTYTYACTRTRINSAVCQDLRTEPSYMHAISTVCIYIDSLILQMKQEYLSEEQEYAATNSSKNGVRDSFRALAQAARVCAPMLILTFIVFSMLFMLMPISTQVYAYIEIENAIAILLLNT